MNNAKSYPPKKRAGGRPLQNQTESLHAGVGRKFGRKEFAYHLGASFVKVRGPHRDMLADHSTLSGQSWDTIDRRRW
jgi:hypothetical protein